MAETTDTTQKLSVEAIGRLAKRVAEQESALDRECSRFKNMICGKEKYDHVISHLKSLEEIASYQRADSLVGGMYQLLVCYNDLLVIEGDLTGEQETSLSGVIHRMTRNFYSIMAAMERASGAHRNDVGGEYYMASAHDPHAYLLPLPAAVAAQA